MGTIMFGLWNTEPEEVLSQKDVTKLAYTRFFIFLVQKNIILLVQPSWIKKLDQQGRMPPLTLNRAATKSLNIVQNCNLNTSWIEHAKHASCYSATALSSSLVLARGAG